MGYACPVCDLPQADGEHLAHHLAITAMTRGGEHEAWLDDRVEAWGESSPADLADAVVEYAEETEYEEVFEDTVHDHGRPDVDFDERVARSLGGEGAGGHGHHRAPEGGRQRGGAVDDRTAAVLEEARELTEQMYDDAEGEGDEDEATGTVDDEVATDDGGDAGTTADGTDTDE